MALALITVDAEYMLQHVSHQTVGLLHLYLLVALCAGQVFRHFILLGHATLLTRKASKAIVARASVAARTLKNIWEHTHADWALKILRFNTQA